MKINSIRMIFIAIGILMVVYTGFNYATTENVVDMGRIEINRDTTHPIHWSPIVGIVLLVVGVAVMIGGKKALVK